MRTYEYINSGWRFSKVGGLPEGRQTEPKSDDNGWGKGEAPATYQLRIHGMPPTAPGFPAGLRNTPKGTTAAQDATAGR